MKKLLGFSLAMVLALPLMAMAQSSSSQSQDPAAEPSGSTQTNSNATRQNDSSQGSMAGQNDSSMGKGSHAAKSGMVKGTIGQDGKTLTSDTDGKTWTIANPDAVKGHEGHHVELKGSTDASTGEIQVTSVKMLKAEKGAMKKDDSMQK
jgi:hypothetical protein